MQQSSRNHHSLSRSQADGPILQLNEQLPLHDVEEFVVRIVFMPVILALDHAQTHHRSIHFAQGLVLPRVRTGVRELLFLNDFQRLILHIEARDVGACCAIAHLE
jgi:hypothetical protein